MKKIILLTILLISTIWSFSQTNTTQSTGGYSTIPAVGTATGILPIANGGTASSLATGTGAVVLQVAPTFSTSITSPLWISNTYSLTGSSTGSVVTTAGTNSISVAHSHTTTETGGVLTTASLSDVAVGTYTPSVTLSTNVAAAAMGEAYYIRTGSYVHVAGYMAIDITTTLLASEVTFTIPIASNFTTLYQLFGTGDCASYDQTGNLQMFSNFSNDKVLVQWQGQVGVANYIYHYQFTYKIL